MAKPIETTPTLYGEDAIRFQDNMDNVKPASKEEIERALAAYNKISAMCRF